MYKNFYELFKQKAEENKGKIYLIDSVTGAKITYGQCDKITNKVANYLISKGITADDIISTVMGNTLEYVYLAIGAFKIGAVLNPLNPRLNKEEIKDILDNTNPKSVFYGGMLLKELGKFSDNYEDKFKPNLDKDMLLLYTSGTTGKPKGIILTQESVLSGALNGVKSVKLKDNLVLFDLLPLYFSGGLIPALIVPLYTNGSSIIVPGFNKDGFWGIIEKYRANCMYVVPTMLNMLMDTDTSGYDLSCVDFILNSSDFLPKELSMRFKEKFKLPLYDIYGLSETLAITIRTEDNDSIGKPLIGVEIRIIEGEIVVKSKTLMKEYFKMPGETKKVIRNGWFYTGDLGYEKDGNYYITGRKKDIIIKGGMNISPKQISGVFLKHKDVTDTATIGIPDEKYGEQIAVFVVIKKNSRLKEKDLMEFAKKHLIKFKVPKEIRIIGKIPRTHLGKVKKDELIKNL
jgi:acyl-CoA synthetase (AMP-forming)/AMP-acid ligase II